MKNYKFLSVIIVMALCLVAAQSVDAQKKTRNRKRTTKTEKKQTKTTQEKEEVFKSAAHMPSFPGGDAALMAFINKNIHYPQNAYDNDIQGKVIVQFVVKKDGKIGEVKVAHGVDPDLDNEAVRVCKSLPAFSPGRNANGDPVNVWYTLPINFKLHPTVDK
ncbi:MAG: energy transducer TonB [Muribaculaceae bacterium]|nr:energy transducer TonB [Muribaculaceae bacterium]